MLGLGTLGETSPTARRTYAATGLTEAWGARRFLHKHPRRSGWFTVRHRRTRLLQDPRPASETRSSGGYLGYLLCAAGARTS